MSPAPPSPRREWIAIGLMTLVGAVLRMASFGQLGLTHFDEGVYAQSGFWAVDTGGPWRLDPWVIPYAPPGFPILVGLSYAVFGVSDLAAIAPAAACGILVVPVVAAIARRAFGPGAAAAAAAFCALSAAHIGFSRKALTDAPFLLAWVAAIACGQRFLARPGLSTAAALGAAVGLAQNFKYNGWLAGVLVAAAAVLGPLVHPPERSASNVRRTLGYGLLAAAVAALIYWPWFRFVEENGGYRTLLSHQRGYMGGVSTWAAHWRQQLGQVVALSGGRSWAALACGVAWLAGRWAADGGPHAAIRPLLIPAVGALLFALLPSAPWWLGLAWAPWLLKDPRPEARLLGVWWLGLSALTPLYHPYARLWLPLHAVGWVLAGGALAGSGGGQAGEVAARNQGRIQRPTLGRAAFAASVLALALVQQWRASPRPLGLSALYQPTSTLRSALDALFPPTRPTGPAEPWQRGVAVRVLAREPAVFYFETRLEIPMLHHSDLGQLLKRGGQEHWALTDEIQLAQELPRAEALRRLTAGPGAPWALVRSAPDRLDPITLLDVRPEAAFDPDPARLRRNSLLLLRPAPEEARHAP